VRCSVFNSGNQPVKAFTQGNKSETPMAIGKTKVHID
jgi:hypothetical protein